MASIGAGGAHRVLIGRTGLIGRTVQRAEEGPRLIRETGRGDESLLDQQRHALHVVRVPPE
ncbi:hypothetical protein [Nonomuraea sp. NPDC005650]|uniref:hypothetical protein n=1 Tax=Nonomuraea sp. NPDC005650 TaxID=3157045 RepID=UPI0033A47AE5